MKPHRSDRSTSSPSDSINSSAKDATKGLSNTSNSRSRSNNKKDDDSRAFDYIMFSDDSGQPDSNNDTALASAAALNQDDHNTTTAANTVTTNTTRRSVSSVPVEKQLSPFDATIHLLKGNLGRTWCLFCLRVRANVCAFLLSGFSDHHAMKLFKSFFKVRDAWISRLPLPWQDVF